MSLTDQIPENLRTSLEQKLVIRASFAAGPSFVAGEVKAFEEPVSFSDGMAWLERFVHVLRGGHMSFEDGSGLWVKPGGSCRYEEYPHKPPLPGIILKDSEGNGREE